MSDTKMEKMPGAPECTHGLTEWSYCIECVLGLAGELRHHAEDRGRLLEKSEARVLELEAERDEARGMRETCGMDLVFSQARVRVLEDDGAALRGMAQVVVEVRDRTGAVLGGELHKAIVNLAALAAPPESDAESQPVEVAERVGEWRPDGNWECPPGCDGPLSSACGYYLPFVEDCPECGAVIPRDRTTCGHSGPNGETCTREPHDDLNHEQDVAGKIMGWREVDATDATD